VQSDTASGTHAALSCVLSDDADALDTLCVPPVPTPAKAALPGVMCYGRNRDDAVAKVQALALRVIAEGTG